MYISISYCIHRISIPPRTQIQHVKCNSNKKSKFHKTRIPRAKVKNIDKHSTCKLLFSSVLGVDSCEESNILTSNLQSPTWSFDNPCQRQAEEVMPAASNAKGADEGTTFFCYLRMDHNWGKTCGNS